MINKVLIANRGEIACRIARVCRQLGVATVGVYSEADAAAQHVAAVDEAVLIGPAHVTESYLRAERILEAAQATGAEAVHPGYGLLSERADFAQACRDHGLRFVGPPASVIALFGDKARARQLAVQEGVPVVPGSSGPVGDADEAHAVASEIGYPVLIKAAWGGGGIGMESARDEKRLRKAFRRAQSRAEAAFGRPEVYLEKRLSRPRHIEIQVLFDQHQNGVHLFERECSVQRRNQKIVEEAPSPLLERRPALRQRLAEAALRLARAADYQNAGTVEFLVPTAAAPSSGAADRPEDGRDVPFYFIETNARLQVEHPVTECVTGLPLIEWQLRVASGERLPFGQGDLAVTGAAVECRLCAEDPDAHFRPRPGTITRLEWVPRRGLRIDSGVVEGDTMSPWYDSLMAKLITYAPTRSEAIRRMGKALRDMILEGVVTNRGFLRDLMADEAFHDGRLHTGFTDELLARLAERERVRRERLA
jgi:acetyl-CoA carboxylase biotin carboxylase subunit